MNEKLSETDKSIESLVKEKYEAKDGWERQI